MPVVGAIGSLAASSLHPGEHLLDNEVVMADLGSLLNMAGCRLATLRHLWLEELL